MEKKLNIFNYFKQDKNWKKTFLIGFLLHASFLILCILSNIIKLNKDAVGLLGILGILEIICILPILGYGAKNINLRIFKPEIIAKFDLKATISTGLKLFFGWIVIMISLMIIGAIAAFIPALIIAPAITATAVSAKSGNFLPIYYFILIIFVFLLIVIDVLFFSLSFISFFMDLKFKSFFNFKRMKKILSVDKKAYFAFLFKLFLLGVLFNILSVIMAITVIGFLFMPALMFWSQLVLNEVVAEYIRKTFKTVKK